MAIGLGSPRPIMLSIILELIQAFMLAARLLDLKCGFCRFILVWQICETVREAA